MTAGVQVLWLLMAGCVVVGLFVALDRGFAALDRRRDARSRFPW